MGGVAVVISGSLTADPVSLERDRQRLVADLLPRLRKYEARYELPSHRLPDELRAGRIRETGEICRWLILWEAYSVAVRGRSPRLG